MKFDRQLRPATETSWVVSCGGKTIPRWRTAAILKIDILPYISEKSSDFHEILYAAADFELDERHVIKNEKVALDRLRVRQNLFLVLFIILLLIFCYNGFVCKVTENSCNCLQWNWEADRWISATPWISLQSHGGKWRLPCTLTESISAGLPLWLD